MKMTDRMTKEERHRCMAAIKGRNTRPEMTVRKYLFSRGLRYRVNVKKLPGSPDIVLRKYGVVVFVDGCFWHGHKDCKLYRLPLTNVEFWKGKVAKNTARDYVNNVDLELEGWRVIRIWECEIKTKEQREERLERLYKEIISGSPWKKPRKRRKKKIRYYNDYPEDFNIAAEPDFEE